MKGGVPRGYLRLQERRFENKMPGYRCFLCDLSLADNFSSLWNLVCTRLESVTVTDMNASSGKLRFARGISRGPRSATFRLHFLAPFLFAQNLDVLNP